ncbi:MAG: glycoside hydrolase family 125 protein [Firmicutes bacterium]|nr:glycoside hydrolase family 125 protein [Candidatus Colivicinus equi]
MKKYVPTGNEMVSLPTINEDNGNIESISFLSMTQKGMIELKGEESPLFEPYISLELNNSLFKRDNYWIPVREANNNDFIYKCTYLTPVKERGFIIHYELTANKDLSFTWGLKGKLAHILHSVNEVKEFEGNLRCYESGWNYSIIIDYMLGSPLFSLAPMTSSKTKTTYKLENNIIDFNISQEVNAKKGETKSLDIFWGLGFEEVAAATSAKEMLRRTYEYEYRKTSNYLNERIKDLGNDIYNVIYNTNLFFCLFYSTGITYDTEEVICATSRSSRYYVSAAYWDRDTMLWSFPTVLDTDTKLAKSILEYIYTRQSKNIGVHSRYIDGTVLEPGFELDELVAPIIALNNYYIKTDDKELINERFVTKTIENILEQLKEAKHPQVELYETFLQPTDDERVYPYITYDNMLVYLAFNALANLYPDKYSCLALEAEKVKKAIMDNCVFENSNGKYFGWSVDLEGNHDIYDEPPGSLQLLAYYGFVESDNEIWNNTVNMIRSKDYKYSFNECNISEIGCPHAPHPWILSLCNSLLSGHKDMALEELKYLKMDNGIACESVDENTGESTTGEAFATCAGFLCHSMLVAIRGNNNE